MRTLHVAALPFPSPQGTQALLHALLSAQAAEHETHLLCYGHGAGVVDGAYTVHRSPAPRLLRSLRSGPALGKPWLDLALALRLRSLERTLAPAIVIAHHVEAAACALLVCRAPVLFVAHTSLAEELPSYFPHSLRAPLRALGRASDRLLVRTASGTCAVSPLLAQLLAEQSERPSAELPLPWPCATPIDSAERAAARAELGFSSEHEVALYAGNLDAYQGLDVLLAACAELRVERPGFRWLLATEAPTAAFVSALRRRGLGELAIFARLDSESARRRAYAAADLALVPRRAAGGLPIKLLDAWARGVPVVAARLALAGLQHAPCAEVVEDDRPGSWRRAISQLLHDRSLASERAHHARLYVAREHDPASASARFSAQLRSML